MKPTYLQMLMTFFKIGAFTFGGGYAMISLIENELVTKNRWLDTNTFTKYLSIAQMSPGILAVNISILMGNFFYGKKGAVLCVIATCMPAFVLILLIAVFFVGFRQLELVDKIFRGIRPVVVALISMPVFSLCKKANISIKTIIIPIAVVVAVAVFGISPVYIIAVSIAVVLLWSAIK